MIDGSLVITMMMMIKMNGWSIETTIPILYHCKNGKEKHQHNQAGRIDILIIIESWIGIKNRFETNKQSFHRNVPNQWLITEQFSIIDLLLDFDTISENGRNIYEWNQINQHNTRNWLWLSIPEWSRYFDMLKIWNIWILSIFNIQKYFPISLNEYYRN